MRIARKLFWTWVALAFVYFLWESARYLGLTGRLAEWQFGWLGYYKPSLTFGGLLLLFGLPALILFLIARRKRREAPLPVATWESARRVARRQLRLLYTLASFAAGAAVISLLLLFTLPGASGSPQQLRIDQPVASAFSGGPAVLTGAHTSGPVIRYSSSLFWTGPTVRYIPLAADDKAASSPRIFLQVNEDGSSMTGESTAKRFSGTLLRNGLPGGVRTLFQDLGIDARKPHYVLFTSRAPMMRPYLLAAVQFAVVSLLILLGALWQARNLRRVDQRIAEVGAVQPA